MTIKKKTDIGKFLHAVLQVRGGFTFPSWDKKHRDNSFTRLDRDCLGWWIFSWGRGWIGESKKALSIPEVQDFVWKNRKRINSAMTLYRYIFKTVKEND